MFKLLRPSDYKKDTPYADVVSFIGLISENSTIRKAFYYDILMKAVKFQHQDVLQMLLKESYGIEDRHRAGRIVKEAIVTTNLEAIRMLLADFRVDPRTFVYDVIDAACVRKQYMPCIPVLLEDYRVDPNLAFRNACRRGENDVVEMLLPDSRIDVAANNFGCLWDATIGGRSVIVKMLLADARVDSLRMFEAKSTETLLAMQDDVFECIVKNVRELSGYHSLELWWDKDSAVKIMDCCKYVADDICKKHVERTTALMFVFHQVGEGWKDIWEPLQERMMGL